MLACLPAPVCGDVIISEREISHKGLGKNRFVYGSIKMTDEGVIRPGYTDSYTGVSQVT